MLEVIEFIASIFKRRLKLTSDEWRIVLRSRVDGNKLCACLIRPSSAPYLRPYTLKVITFDNVGEHGTLKCTPIIDIVHHELTIGETRHGDNHAGDDMYCLTTVDTEQMIKRMYLKKELLKSVY